MTHDMTPLELTTYCPSPQNEAHFLTSCQCPLSYIERRAVLLLSAMTIFSALLALVACVSSGPVPVANPLFHEPQPLYPDIGAVYPVSSSLFSERDAAYRYREPRPYLAAELDGSLDGMPESDPFEGQNLAASGAGLADRLAGQERSQLLSLLAGGLAAAESGDYGPLGYGTPEDVADWYEALGLVPPYAGSDGGEDYGDYPGQMGAWPQLPTGPSQAVDKKDASGPAAAPLAEHPAEEEDDDEDDTDDGNGDDGDDTGDSANESDADSAANLVKQIEELRRSIRTEDLHRASSQSATPPVRHPVPPPASGTAAPVPAGHPSHSVQPEGEEAPLDDQLRAAAAEPTPEPPAPLADSETAYETIKRFLVMEDALKRVSRRSGANPVPKTDRVLKPISCTSFIICALFFKYCQRIRVFLSQHTSTTTSHSC